MDMYSLAKHIWDEHSWSCDGLYFHDHLCDRQGGSQNILGVNLGALRNAGQDLGPTTTDSDHVFGVNGHLSGFGRNSNSGTWEENVFGACYPWNSLKL